MVSEEDGKSLQMIKILLTEFRVRKPSVLYIYIYIYLLSVMTYFC